MPTVFVPAILRPVVSMPRVDVAGSSVGEIIDELEARFPGVAAILIAGDDVAPGIAVSINDQISQMGLMEPVAADAEVHFLPAISGG